MKRKIERRKGKRGSRRVAVKDKGKTDERKEKEEWENGDEEKGEEGSSQ